MIELDFDPAEWEDVGDGRNDPCSHCGGEGTCEAGCDPLWYDDVHRCHACNGSGLARDQVIW